MARKSAKRSPASPRTRAARGSRPSWRGQMTFGLVSVAVEAWNALDKSRGDVHFHMLHRTCHRRIRYAKMCPVHGEVSNDEIVSGYEIKKGSYVEVDPKELDEFRPENDRALHLDAFIAPEAIDPIYFDGRTYYLGPAEAGASESYAVLTEAMARENKVAVGQVVFSGKRQLVLVRPVSGVLVMAMLHYAEEIRPPQKHPAPRNVTRQVHLAQTLIEQWSEEKFDLAQYHDDYRDQVKKLLEARKRGHEVEEPKEKETPPRSLNLIEALKRSVAEHRRGPTKARSRRRSA
jgi:DNA end-binding protein Ku